MEWEHKSKVARKMHACGHDAHVAMLFGAAKILKDHEKYLQVRFLYKIFYMHFHFTYAITKNCLQNKACH